VAIPWIKKIREGGQLTVFNKANTWTDAVNASIDAFNRLSFGVTLVKAKDEKSANIVLVLANGHTEYTYQGTTVTPGAGFSPDRLHGKTRAYYYEQSPKEIFFAVTFLPGKVNGTKKQKEVIVVHEFIHAAGMDEHDDRGIMFAQMGEDGDGLIEYLHDKGSKAMPPIRVGGQTACIMNMLWSGGAACKAS
jgi:hypothetical protein